MEKFEHSLIHLLLAHEQEHPDRVYLRQPREGKWHEFTWREVIHQARQVANFLQSINLNRGDKVALFSKNCAEWFITDFGICLAGMVNVPLFSNQHESSVKYVLEHAEVKAVFMGKLDNYQQVFNYIPQHLTTIGLNYHPDMQTTYTWKDVLAFEPLQEIVLPKPEDLVTIIYSSGTSGMPKGAMYTHQSLANYMAIFPKDLGRSVNTDFHHFLSYLPLAHVYERSAIELGSVSIPCDVSFVESLDTFSDNLRETQPTLFAAVPRIWGIFQQKVEQKIPPAVLNILLKTPFVSSLIKKKILHQLGLSRSRGNYSGASHLPVSIIQFFDKLGVHIQEGYGQTENFAYATLSLPNERRLGYVGSPRLHVEIKTNESGELLMKCPCLMKGYYKEEEATAAAITDGWLHTGDIVEIDEKQRVKILGRVSENFKNQKGEFIVPTPIEKKFAENSLIEHLCLIGQGLASNVMLISLTAEAKRLPREEVKASLKRSLHYVNTNLKSYEKISHILVVQDAWAPENNLLTPTLKVKRRKVEERYQSMIHESVDKPNIVLWEQEA